MTGARRRDHQSTGLHKDGGPCRAIQFHAPTAGRAGPPHATAAKRPAESHQLSLPQRPSSALAAARRARRRTPNAPRQPAARRPDRGAGARRAGGPYRGSGRTAGRQNAPPSSAERPQTPPGSAPGRRSPSYPDTSRAPAGHRRGGPRDQSDARGRKRAQRRLQDVRGQRRIYRRCQASRMPGPSADASCGSKPAARPGSARCSSTLRSHCPTRTGSREGVQGAACGARVERAVRRGRIHGPEPGPRRSPRPGRTPALKIFMPNGAWFLPSLTRSRLARDLGQVGAHRSGTGCR